MEENKEKDTINADGAEKPSEKKTCAGCGAGAGCGADAAHDDNAEGCSGAGCEHHGKGYYRKEAEELRKKVEKLESELKENDDRYLRMAAEYDNFRRRSREERQASYDAAVADAVKEILPIIDNLERAAMYDDGEKVREGVAMTAKAIATALKNLGVEEIGKSGETFDPQLHNAVLHEEDDTKGEGEIVDVLQKGYKKGNKMIRYAMVKTVN